MKDLLIIAGIFCTTYVSYTNVIYKQRNKYTLQTLSSAYRFFWTTVTIHGSISNEVFCFPSDRNFVEAFRKHIQEAITKAKNGIALMKFLSKYVSPIVLDKTYKMYVRPHLDYGDVILHDQLTDMMNSLEFIQYQAGSGSADSS